MRRCVIITANVVTGHGIGDPLQSELKVILLAAGRGSRLQELTRNRPKALVQVSGRPLLSWTLDAIRDAGMASPVIVTGYLPDAFSEFGLEQIHNPYWQSTNMVSSLLCAREIMRSHRTLISYTDILYSKGDLTHLIAAQSPICLSYDPHWSELWKRRFEDPLEDAETFAINVNGSIIDIGARPDSLNQIQGQYIGLLCTTSAGWRNIEAVVDALDPDEVAKLDMTRLLRTCIVEYGISVQGIPLRDVWCEIDAPSDIPIAEDVAAQLWNSE